jgi:hypothetical protein
LLHEDDSSAGASILEGCSGPALRVCPSRPLD